MRRAWVVRVGVVVAVAAVAVGLRSTVLQPDPVPVTVYEVARGPVEDTVTNGKAGTVSTRRRATISPDIGGRVAEMAVREGRRVAKGDLLLRLDDDSYAAEVRLQQSAVETARAGVDEACAAAAQAAREAERTRDLARDGVVSTDGLDRAESRRESTASACSAARARVHQAEAALEVARVALAKTVIRAPFAGVVAEVTAEVGEWITPSPPGMMIPPIVELIDDRALYVSAPMDEVDIARVTVGQPVRVTLDAYLDVEYAGRVSRVAPYVEDAAEQNRTLEIEVDFTDDRPQPRPVPGASADVEVILDSVGDAIRVPSYALIEGRRLLVLDDGVLVSRDVEVGLANWEFTEIRDGLDVGELVVTSLDRVEVQAGAEARAVATVER